MMKYNFFNKLVKTMIILGVSFIVIYLLVNGKTFLNKINIKSLKDYILSYGSFAFLVFLVIYSIKPVIVIFPTTIFSVIAGNIFGSVKGLALTMIGVFTSGSLAFFISRKFGKPVISKIAKNKLIKLDDNIQEHGFKIIFLMRLSTFFPYDVLSYSAGLTKIKYGDFITASILGSLPEMMAYDLLGENIDKPLSVKLFFALAFVVIIGIGTLIIRQYGKVSNEK